MTTDLKSHGLPLAIGYLFITAICVSHGAPAEPTRAWSRLFGDFGNKLNNFDSWPEGVCVGSSSNVYVAGTTEDSFDGQPMHPNAYAFPYLVKFSTAGVKLWTRTWGAIDWQTARVEDCEADNGGKVFVTGWATNPFDGQPAPAGVDPCFITTFDADGNKLWSRTWGYDMTNTWRNSGAEAHGCGIDYSGCVFSVGRTRWQFDGQANPSYASTYSPCLAKYSADGTKLWVRIWGSAAWNEARDVACDNANSAYVVGWTRGPIDGQAYLGSDDMFMTKFDKDGSNLWTRLWGSTQREAAEKLCIDASNNIYVAGWTQGAFDGQPNDLSYRFFLTKFDVNGNRLWSRIWGECDDIVGGVCVDSLGNIFVTGRHYVPAAVGDISQPSLTKFDKDGTLVFVRNWASPNNARNNSNNGGVAADRYGDIYVASYTPTGFDGYPRPGTSFVTKWLVGDGDADGLADSWETACFGDLSHAPGDDTDEDGMAAADEYTAGTSDGDPNDKLRIISASKTTNGTHAVAWSARAGRQYTLLSCTNLQGSWSINQACSNAPGMDGTMYSTNAVTTDAMFYRVGVTLDD